MNASITNKVYAGLGILIALTGTQASAACMDGQKLAQDAAEKAARNRFQAACEVIGAENTMKWPSRGLEGWTIKVSCTSQPIRRVGVRLQEDQNNQCTVTKVSIGRLDGSQCGLTDQFGGENDEWIFEAREKTLNLSEMTPSQLRALPLVNQQQIVATVEDKTVQDVVEALNRLKEGSEAGEVYLQNFTYLGQKFTAITSYPGGNAGGLIFKYGSAKPHAENGDDSISCVE